MANIATSAPHATPDASCNRPTITPATAVPWVLLAPVSSVVPLRNTPVKVFVQAAAPPQNAGWPRLIPLSTTPTVWLAPGATSRPVLCAMRRQAASARIRPRLHCRAARHPNSPVSTYWLPLIGPEPLPATVRPPPPPPVGEAERTVHRQPVLAAGPEQDGNRSERAGRVFSAPFRNDSFSGR